MTLNPWCMFWTQLYRTSQFHGPPLAYLSLCFLPLSPLEAECQWDQGSHSVVARLVGQDLFYRNMPCTHDLEPPFVEALENGVICLKKRWGDFKTIPKNGTWMSCFPLRSIILLNVIQYYRKSDKCLPFSLHLVFIITILSEWLHLLVYYIVLSLLITSAINREASTKRISWKRGMT